MASAGSNLMALASGFNISSGDFYHVGLQVIVVCYPPLIAIYLANGDGTYRVSQSIQPQAVAQVNPAQPSQPTVVGMLPYATALADFNGDGIPDLAMMSYPNSVVIFRGVGDGTFAPMTVDMTTFLPRAYMVGNNPTFGVAGDFNRDGRVDVAVSAEDGTISILQGNGDGSLTLVNLIQGYGSGAIVAGDFNNDGILDLAAINTGSNTVRVLPGRRRKVAFQRVRCFRQARRQRDGGLPDRCKSRWPFGPCSFRRQLEQSHDAGFKISGGSGAGHHRPQFRFQRAPILRPHRCRRKQGAASSKVIRCLRR